MNPHLLGGALALLAATCWAAATILYKQAGERVQPLPLNLFKNVVCLALLVPTLWILEGGLQTFESCSAEDVGILALSGFLGISIADTLFFWSLHLLGVGLVSIVDCLYTPFIVIFSMLLLGESLTGLQYAGAALVLAAVCIASGHAPPRDRSRSQIVLGIILGALDMAVMTFGITIAKPVIERTPLIAATAVRVAAGAAFLVPVVLLLPRAGALRSAFRPSPVWKFTVPASILGAYLANVFWIGGFKNTYASVAGTLNQTSTIFALILAAVFLGEAFTRRKILAVVLAFTGVALVLVFR